MRANKYLFIIIWIIQCSPFYTSNFFEIQETVTILCRQFPLILKSNDTDLKCARLRTDTSVSTGDFNLQDPSAIILFTILNLSLTSSNFNDITIDFDLSSDQPASIVDIRLALLVTYGQFSINNQTTILYNSSMIPILHWKNGIFNRYDVIDTIVLEDKLFYDDSSLCKWDLQFWNHLFHDENFPHVPYSYFLQLNTSQLHFTLVGTKNTSALPTTPSPFLNVLYCIPFMMEPTEIVLISLFSFIVCISLIGGCIWHCFRKDYNKPPNYFDLHHQQMVTPLEKDKRIMFDTVPVPRYQLQHLNVMIHRLVKNKNIDNSDPEKQM